MSASIFQAGKATGHNGKGFVFAVPGAIDQATGGYIYDRRVLDAWRAAGLTVPLLTLPDRFPNPTAEDLAATRAAFAAQPPGTTMVVDGLAFGCLPPDLLTGLPLDWVALVHHPLALETGLSAAQAAALAASERAALTLARHVLATSETTAATLMQDYGVAPDRITVSIPGVDRRSLAEGIAAQPLPLLAVGTVIPRKAYEVLVTALSGLADLPWHLTIVGSETRAPDYAATLRRQIADAGLADRITFAGEIAPDQLDDAYRRAGLFVHPALYEGFGMALAEALTAGLPVVASSGGAVADWLPDAFTLKVPPGDANALAAALRQAIADPALRITFGASAARWAAFALPYWRDTADRLAHAILVPTPETTVSGA